MPKACLQHDARRYVGLGARSLRAARGSLLLTTGTAYHRKESKGGRPKTAGITLDGMNEH